MVNLGPQAHRGVMPADCRHAPYLSRAAVAREMAAGLKFRGLTAGGDPVAVMGRQGRWFLSARLM